MTRKQSGECVGYEETGKRLEPGRRLAERRRINTFSSKSYIAILITDFQVRWWVANY
jgi:hypothetical protein